MNNTLLAILATWRISHMLIHEAAPYDLLSKFRHKVGVRYDKESKPYGTNEFARGLLCPHCNSVWIGWVIALLLGHKPIKAFVAGLAYSAGAIVIEKLVNK
jgi:hypothetical protein